MKKILIFVSIIGIIVMSGSLFYYYVVFLPQQSTKNMQDISAIRSVIAPTPAEQQAQNQRMAQKEAQFEKALNDYFDCIPNMYKKQSEYIQKQCPPNPNDPFDSPFLSNSKRSKCITAAENSATYKSYNCPSPY